MDPESKWTIGTLKEHIEETISMRDEAVKVALAERDKATGRTETALQIMMEVADKATLLAATERDKAIQSSSESLRDHIECSSRELRLMLEERDKAITKAENAVNQHFDQMNSLQDRMQHLINTFATRDLVDERQRTAEASLEKSELEAKTLLGRIEMDARREREGLAGRVTSLETLAAKNAGSASTAMVIGGVALSLVVVAVNIILYVVAN